MSIAMSKKIADEIHKNNLRKEARARENSARNTNIIVARSQANEKEKGRL